jgi:heme-degrading monooxygenase HmoA
MSDEIFTPAVARSIAVLNTFTPKPGRLEDFIAVQTAALPGLAAHIRGFRGSRLYRAADGSRVVMVSVFDTPDELDRFSASEPFIAHRARISELLERAEPVRCELVYEAGEI